MKKREREREGEDDGGGAPQGKRAARVGESSEANGDPPRLTTDDALQYLKDVKEKFKDDKEKYNEFLEVMKDFKAHRVDTTGVIMRVKELFKGHRYLILGFNAFLPPGFEITLPAEERKQQQPPLPVAVQHQQQPQQQPPQQQPPQQLAVEFDQAINYVNKIKARFHADEHVYKAFLEILNMYRRGNKNINEVYQEVALLFADHSDLLQEFTYFLPGTSNGATSHHQEHHHHHPPPPPPMANIKPGLQPQRPREIAFGKPVSNGGLLIAKKEKIGGVSSRDREAERRAEKSRKGVEKKDIGDRKEGIDRVDGGREKEKDFFEQKPKRASARNATDAIRRQSQAGEGGEGFSGPGAQMSTDDSKPVKGAALQYPIFDKVKSRLRNRDTYQEFLKCLNIFSQEIISRVELQSLVGDILGKHADLLEGFNEFLTHCENVEGYLAGVFSERKLGDFAEGAPLKVVKTERDGERDRNREKDRERERERDRERKKEKERERIREKIREREKEKLREKERERERGVKERERDHGVKDVAHKVSTQKDKFVNKPISELDLSNCERCTPSYRLLPKQYPKPVSSHRTALGISVLNDNWVSVTSGSEDYSLKNSRKNQHEESLFRCEDDRYELDMLLETTAATAKLVGQYTLKQEGESGKAEALPPLEEFLSPIHLRCIERIYGDHGLDILEVMKKSTSRAMPVIHSRLVQKEEEWTKCREEMNKVWSEVYTKNVYKALDHRSFNFKQQDKKALSTKSLLADIKEMNENEKRKREDDAMLAIAAGNRRLLLPDVLYKFGDASIHDDLYQIIKYSSEEISSSPEHTEKTMRSLRTVLAPMLGISLRRHCEEDMEEASDGKGLDGNAMESGGGSEGDETSSPEGGGGGGLGGEEEVTVGKNVENVGVERSRARVLGGSDGDLAGGFERNVGECLVAENADIGVSDHGSEGANEVSGRGTGLGDAEGTAARTEGSGWLHAENSGRKQSCLAGERSESEARINDGLVPDGNGSGVRDTVDREEGELSPSSEREDRNKVKYSPRRMGIEENGVKIFDHEEVDAEAGGVAEMDHDQDANDKRAEATAQKSSEDSDNPSEGADESSASEQSSDEQSEHEEEEDEQEEKVESEGEAEGMADADDGDEDGNSSLATQAFAYAHCKPLAVHSASAMASLADSHTKAAGRVFYGNDMAFILSRLYQILYERIRSAKANAELAGKKKVSDGGAAPNLYSRFMQVLYGLLDGSLDNSKFEDECRDIIGTQSYILFTLDKLIFKLVKQLQAAAADEGVQKLLALNAYEYEREAVDLVYYADACVVLHDENLYRFENRSNSSELLIQLMENPEKLDFPGNALGGPFQKYLDEFTKSAPTRKSPMIRRILKRKYAGEEQDAVIERALLNTKVVNGLENKISCRTSKVSYVLDTEDLFLRLTARRFAKHKEKWELEKKQRFGDWLDKARSKLSDSASESSISR